MYQLSSPLHRKQKFEKDECVQIEDLSVIEVVEDLNQEVQNLEIMKEEMNFGLRF